MLKEGRVGKVGIGSKILPSLMLATPGCWAWEEMGALFAGVFWGVLSMFEGVRDGKPGMQQTMRNLGDDWGESTYGATGKSAFLFLMGSDIAKKQTVD